MLYSNSNLLPINCKDIKILQCLIFFWKGWNPWRNLGYRVISLWIYYSLYYTPYNMYPRISVLVLSKELWSFHSFVSVLQLVCVSIVYCWYLIRVINCEIKLSVFVYYLFLKLTICSVRIFKNRFLVLFNIITSTKQDSYVFTEIDCNS